MTNQELTLLAQRAKEGDKNALNDLIGACYDDLSHFALRTVKDPELAADITQDSCIEIISGIGNLQNPERFGSWARTIVYHRCMRHFNSKKEIIADETEDGDTIFDKLPDEDEGVLPEQVVEDKEFQRIMQTLLDELPEEQRAALMLYYYDKLSVKQIASIQGTGEGTVKSRLNYGRKAVKAQVESYEKKSGTKLHAALPPVLFKLFGDRKESAPAANLPSSVTAAIESFGSASAASASTVSVAGVGAKGGVVAAKGAALAVKKIVIGAVAALMAAGGVAGGVFLATSGLLSKPAVSTEQASGSRFETVSDDASSESEGGNVTPTEHPHPGRVWEFEDNAHYLICTDCGQQVGGEEAHVYDDEGNCTVCDCGYFSKGLAYEQIGKFTLQVTGIGSCTDQTVVIPEVYKGCSVTSIKTEAFRDNTQIKKVVIPGEFESVGQHAFSGCTNLTEVEFLGSCQLLQHLSFENCTALKKVTLPVMPKIEVAVFSNSSSLEELIVPEGVETIGTSAFYDCTALKKVSFPSTLRQIENMAFDGCSSLEALSLPEGLERIGEQAFFRCDALVELSLPGSVKSVDRAAFGLCASLKEVTFLEGIKSVESGAFENCYAIEKVTIPSSFETIVGAFAQSDKLTAVHYTGTVVEWHELEKSMQESRWVAHCTDGDIANDSVLHRFPEAWSISDRGHVKKCACGVRSEYGAHTLENGYCTECGWGASCGHLEFMEMPDGYYVSWVGECTDSHIVIPESYEGKIVVGIASGAFVYCTTLEELTLPSSVKVIGRQAFEGCENLKSVNLWDVDHIEGFAFRNCRALEKVEISAEFVEDSVFDGCTGLREVVLIADEVYGNTFSGCTGLQKVTLSSKMSGLDLLTFGGCTGLTEICYYGTVEQWNAMDKVEMEDDEFEQDLSWNYQTGEYTVYCFDGTVPKTVL